MTPITYFILGVVVGGVLLLWLRRSKTKTGLIARQQGEKAAHKQAIVSAFAEKGRLTNDEVQKLIGVSDATATRYLEELEKEGKLRQVSAGKYTYYERV